jgi:GNAT superfamily N-acetyltransferase
VDVSPAPVDQTGDVTPSTALHNHLEDWLGSWPPGPGALTVVGSEQRQIAGWDGRVRAVLGISTPSGTVLSVPPDRADAVASLGDDLDAVAAGLPAAVGLDGGRMFTGVFRWTEAPAPGDDAGEWLPPGDPRVLPWLEPFNGGVLVAFSAGRVAAGVGIKRHDRWGRELAVVTQPGFRGQGWAQRLVSQAARRVIAEGAVPTYLHAEGNLASARTADASGFPDRGWRIIGVSGGET